MDDYHGCQAVLCSIVTCPPLCPACPTGSKDAMVWLLSGGLEVCLVVLK